MSLYQIDPHQRPTRSLDEGRRITGERQETAREWHLPGGWSVLGWVLFALTFAESILSFTESILSYLTTQIGGILSGNPIFGPWWWAAIACSLVFVLAVMKVVVCLPRRPTPTSARLFSVRRCGQILGRHWLVPLVLSCRLLRRSYGRSDTIRLASMAWVVIIPLAILALPDEFAATLGALACSESSVRLALPNGCHDAMAFAESRAWPPVTLNVPAVAGVIVATKFVVWLSVSLSIGRVVTMVTLRRKVLPQPTNPLAWRRLALWLRLNPVRPVSVFWTACALIALYDTSLQLAVHGVMAVAPPIVTTPSLTAFVLWAIAGAVFVRVVSDLIIEQIVERRVDALLQDGGR